MMFERLFKWMTKEVSNRSGLIATPTALLVDGSYPLEAPPPVRLPSWIERGGPNSLPPKAVAFLTPDPTDRDVLVYIVNVEKQTIETTLELSSKEVGEFAAIYFRSAARPTDSRTLLNAPPWFTDPQWSHQVPGRRLPVKMAALAGAGGGGGMGTAAVIGDEKKPPQPPRLQALVALAEETATLQDLPVVVTAEA